MSTAVEVLALCAAQGIRLRRDVDALVLDYETPPAAQVVSAIKAHKPELLMLLDESQCAVRELDVDALEDWLRDEGLCLVLRGTLLTFAGSDGKGEGEPSTALRKHVQTHHTAIHELLGVGR